MKKLFTTSDGTSIYAEDLLREAYENVHRKRDNILATVKLFTDKITNMNDAIVLSEPLIRLQDLAIKNDEQLIKILAMVSKNGKSGESVEISNGQTRAALLEQAKQIGLDPEAFNEYLEMPEASKGE